MMMNSKDIKPPLLVSACLLGNPCRYNGTGYDLPALVDSLHAFTIIPVCPEGLGELPVPRPPAELVGGDGDDLWYGEATVQTEDGTNLTAAFRAGALRALELAKEYGVKMVVLKDRRSIMRFALIHDGTLREG